MRRRFIPSTFPFREVLFILFGRNLDNSSGGQVGGGMSEDMSVWHKYVKFDPKVSRVVASLAAAYASCWLPVHTAIVYYLWPYGAPPTVRAHAFTSFIQVV